MIQSKQENMFFLWTPRIMAIVFICFLAIFALDVFEADKSATDIMVGLFMHLIPNFLLLGALILAWKREFAGGLLFILLSFLSVAFFNTYKDPVIFLMVSFPPLIIGILFVMHDTLGSMSKPI